MSVKKDSSGRRSIQVEVEVPFTPEEVWETIATGPGTECWFMQLGMEIEPREGGEITMDMGTGKIPIATVRTWEPPHKLYSEGKAFGPEGPTVATEWTVEARSGDSCVIRVVHSLFSETDDWDKELESLEGGWPKFFRVLYLYLTKFRGQKGAIASVMMPASSVDEGWNQLADGLGISGLTAGNRWQLEDSGAPGLAGDVDHVKAGPERFAIVILEQPHPGILFTGVAEMNGVPTAHLSVYRYGDNAAATAQAEQPKWQERLQGWLSAKR